MNRVYLDPATNRIIMCVPFERKTRQGRVELRTAATGHPAVNWEPQRKLVLALARAQLWQDQLDSGKFKSVGELSAKLGFKDSSYVSRTLNLALLDWDIKELILDGREPSGMSLAKLAQSLPLGWEEQRAMFGLDPRIQQMHPDCASSAAGAEAGQRIATKGSDDAAICAVESSIPAQKAASTRKSRAKPLPTTPTVPRAVSRAIPRGLFDDFAG